MRGVQVVKDRWLDAGSSAACLALASEPQPAVPLPAPPLAGASGPYARQRTADKIYWAAYRDCMAGSGR